MSHSESLVILNYTCYLHLDNISQTQNRTSIRNHQQILFQPTNFYPIGRSIGKRLRAVCFLHAARHSSWTFLFAKQCFLFSDSSFSLSFVFTRLYYQTAQTLFPFHSNSAFTHRRQSYSSPPEPISIPIPIPIPSPIPIPTPSRVWCLMSYLLYSLFHRAPRYFLLFLFYLLRTLVLWLN
jgi:hypothetical protein